MGSEPRTAVARMQSTEGKSGVLLGAARRFALARVDSARGSPGLLVGRRLAFHHHGQRRGPIGLAALAALERVGGQVLLERRLIVGAARGGLESSVPVDGDFGEMLAD